MRTINITFVTGGNVTLKDHFQVGGGVAGTHPNGETLWYSFATIATFTETI